MTRLTLPGIVLETFLAGVVEIVLLIVLVVQDGSSGSLINIIRDAILGSILANLLLCLGCCFFVGGLRQTAQNFDSAISEVGSGLLLTAGFALSIPCAFFSASKGTLNAEGLASDRAVEANVLAVSRATAIILLVAYFTCVPFSQPAIKRVNSDKEANFLCYSFLWFQMRTHHSMYHAVLESDEEKDMDRQRDLAKAKLTLTECAIAMIVALVCVALHAKFLGELRLESPHRDETVLTIPRSPGDGSHRRGAARERAVPRIDSGAACRFVASVIRRCAG